MFRGKECHICTLKNKVFCVERAGSRNMVIDNKVEHVAGPISLCPVAIGLMSLENYLRRLKIKKV